MAVDDIIVWTGFVTGIIGTIVATIALAWQVHQWRRGQKERDILTLNKNVLWPLSEVVIGLAGGWPDGIDLFVPKNAFPSEMSPKIPDNGLPVEQLTGSYDAEMYLMMNKETTDVWKNWEDANRTLKAYNNARRERHKLVETMVTEGMAVAYPNLAPAVKEYPQQPGTYSLANAITVVERISYQHAAYDSLQMGVTRITTTLQGQTLYLLSEQNSLPIIIGIPEADVDEEKLKALLLRWITNDRVREFNLAMVKARGALESALEHFRSGLRERCLVIDRTGGP